MRWKTAVLPTLAAAAGCSSKDTEEPEPAELTKFEAEIPG